MRVFGVFSLCLFSISLVARGQESSSGERFQVPNLNHCRADLSDHESDRDGEILRHRAYQSLMHLGLHFFRSKAYPKAMTAYESAFRTRSIPAGQSACETASPDDFIMYGLALEMMHEERAIQRAVAVLKEGKELYPENISIRLNLASYAATIGNLESQEFALREYEWILQREPLHAKVLYNRAIVLMHTENWEGAAQSLEFVIPDLLSAYGRAWFASTPWVIRQHEKFLKGVPVQPSRMEHLKDFVEGAFPLIPQNVDEPKTLILEFGVASGASTGTIARHVAKHNPNQIVHGFDSFIGLPESWAQNEVGDYTQDGIAPDAIMPGNVQFHAGWFNETLPLFLENHPNQPVVAIHIDADLYSSTIEVLELLVTRIPPGGIIRFDEYFVLGAFDDEQAKEFDQDEARAWIEIMDKYGVKSQPVNWHGQSVTFSVLSNPSFDAEKYGSSTV